jgi:hypothetical protein
MRIDPRPSPSPVDLRQSYNNSVVVGEMLWQTENQQTSIATGAKQKI